MIAIVKYQPPTCFSFLPFFLRFIYLFERKWEREEEEEEERERDPSTE